MNASKSACRAASGRLVDAGKSFAPKLAIPHVRPSPWQYVAKPQPSPSHGHAHVGPVHPGAHVGSGVPSQALAVDAGASGSSSMARSLLSWVSAVPARSSSTPPSIADDCSPRHAVPTIPDAANARAQADDRPRSTATFPRLAPRLRGAVHGTTLPPESAKRRRVHRAEPIAPYDSYEDPRPTPPAAAPPRSRPAPATPASARSAPRRGRGRARCTQAAWQAAGTRRWCTA